MYRNTDIFSISLPTNKCERSHIGLWHWCSWPFTYRGVSLATTHSLFWHVSVKAIILGWNYTGPGIQWPVNKLVSELAINPERGIRVWGKQLNFDIVSHDPMAREGNFDWQFSDRLKPQKQTFWGGFWVTPLLLFQADGSLSTARHL